MINLQCKYFIFWEKYEILRSNLIKVVEVQRKKIVNYQLIKQNCLFDNIGNALSNIIAVNIIKVWDLVHTKLQIYFLFATEVSNWNPFTNFFSLLSAYVNTGSSFLVCGQVMYIDHLSPQIRNSIRGCVRSPVDPWVRP